MSEVQSDSTTQVDTGIVMYGADWCPDCRFAKRWFDTHHVAYNYVDVEQDEKATEYVIQLNGGRRTIPTIVFPDGSILVEPDSRALAAKFPERV